MLAINKADGDNKPRAIRAQASYQSALRLMRPDAVPPVVTCSALEKTGLDELWVTVMEEWNRLEGSGELAEKRRGQQVQWMWDMVEDGLRRALRSDPAIATLLAELEEGVAHGRATPSAAAWRVLERFAERAPEALKRG
jgi:LAO/AO transport system kinase